MPRAVPKARNPEQHRLFQSTLPHFKSAGATVLVLPEGADPELAESALSQFYDDNNPVQVREFTKFQCPYKDCNFVFYIDTTPEQLTAPCPECMKVAIINEGGKP